MDSVLQRLILAAFTLLAPAALAEPVRLIPQGDVWKYLDNGTDQGTLWREAAYDDSHWPMGPAQLGYGDGDEATMLSFGPNGSSKYITTYFRRAFVLGDFITVSNLFVRLLRDDGAVVYINGIEVFRSNMPAGPVNYQTLAIMPVGGADETTNFHSAAIPPNLVSFGLNVVAVELHQQAAVSADVSFDLELIANVDNVVPVPVVSVAGIDTTGSEISPLVDRAEDPAVFRLSRTGSTAAPLWVNISMTGTAQNGIDYQAISNRIEIPGGSASTDVLVHVLDDALVEGDESVQLRIIEPACADTNATIPGCYHVGSPAVTAVILDDDQVDPPSGGILVATGSVWKYLDDGSNQGSVWQQPAFDDSSWASGPAQLGYGDGDEATVVSYGADAANKHVTTYFRHAFTVASNVASSNLTLRVLRDDGVVVYLNGNEIFRSNMPEGEITSITLASMNAGDENVYVVAQVPAGILQPGLNVVAAEVHQVNQSSSDLGFDLELATSDSPPTVRTIIDVAALDPNASEVSPNTLGNPGRFAIRRRNNVQTPVVVTFALSGSAENGVDYNFLTNRVFMSAGMTQAVVTVTPRYDMLAEGTETVVLTIEPPVCVTLAPPPPECYVVGPSNEATVFITDGPATNQPPVVGIVSPNNGASFPAGGNIHLAASAHDPENAAVMVEFFAGTNRIGRATASLGAPYTLVWSNVLAGDYLITARATDSSGLTAVSPPVLIHVLGGSNSGVLIPFGAVWRYLDNGADQGAAWIQPGFNDSSWASGPAQLGYGDGDEATVVDSGPDPANKYITTYFRHTFAVTNLAGITRLVGRLRQDDGSVVYLNGIEIFRGNLPAGPVFFNTLASLAVEEQIVDFTASPSALVAGPNVIAVEMHQSSVLSSDLSFDLNLVLERQNTGTNGGPHISIFSPTNQSRFPAGANIALTAVTTSRVSLVEFFANGLKLGDAHGPLPSPAGSAMSWLLTWSNALAGEYTLVARATDTNGLAGFSPPIRVFVGTNAVLPGVGVFAADAWAAEGGANGALDPGIFRFWREGPTDAPLTVFYTVGGDATSGLDYQPIGRDVTIPGGTSVVDVVVRALDDMLVEATETVVLTLAPNAAYRVGTANNPAATRGTVHIVDNDPGENKPPTVRMLRPADGDEFHSPANIQLAAMAEDPDGDHPLLVEFFANGQRLGTGQFIPGACITCPYYALTWSNAPAGVHTLTARATDSRGAATISAPIAVTVHDGSSLQRELHAVGVYSGDVAGGFSRNHETGSVSIHVNRPDRHVTLFLSAYEPVVWNVTTASGTTIEKVILGGYYRQTVTGLPPGVQVINRFYDEGQGTSDYILIGYNTNSVVLLRALAKLCALTGLDLSSFHGGYHAAAFTVDSVDDNETFRCDYPQPVDPSALPNLSFTVSFAERGGRGLFHQNYTLAGPQNASRLLPALRVVADAGARYYYGAESHAMWQFDSQTGAFLEMDLGDGVPELSWPTGVAFDSQRNRVLLSSLGGEGFLYSYAPAADAWSLVASLNNIDVNGLGYHAPSDSIYAVASTYEDYHPRGLHRLDAGGQRTGFIPLPLMPFDFGTGGYETELVSVGEYLVLLLEPNSGFYHGNSQPRESRIYLIDPRSGQAWLTYRRPLVADSDRDGVPDDRDQCPYTVPGTLVDPAGCPIGQGDSDGDGVADALDQCPGTPPNSIVNGHGCSLRQLCPCDGSWTNHAQYVNCVIRHTWEFYRQNLITGEQRRAIISEAVMSHCGRTADEALCMHILPQTTEECQRDGLAFVLSGDVTGSYVVEYTTDFVNWSPVQTQSNAVTGEVILCPVSTEGPRFYRLRKL